MNHYFITSLLIVTSLCSHSQSFYVENFGIQEGMPSAEVYHAFQDKHGFIWFATDNGVVRFDGLEMKSFHVRQGLPDPVVFSFHEDSKGRLWFRSYSGKLSYFDHDKISAYPHNPQLLALVGNNLICSIYPDDDDNLWLCTNTEIVKIDKNGKTSREPADANTFFVKTIDSTYVYGFSGPVTDIKSFTIDGEKFPIQLSNQHYPSQVIHGINWQGKILFSVGSEIFCYHKKKLTKIFTGVAPIISLSKDKKGHLWVGYLNRGVDRFINFPLAKPWSPVSLQDKSVTKVLEDNEGGLWFTTLEKGAYYAPKPAVENFLLENQTKIRAVTTNSNCVLVGDMTGDLTALNQMTRKVEWTKSFGSPIISLFVDNASNHWISTSMGIFTLDKNHNQLAFDHSTAVDFSESKKGELWTAGGSLVSRIDPGSLKKVPIKRLDNILRAVCVTDSNIYVAGRTGLEIYSTKMEYRVSPKQLQNLKITDIFRANDSTILLATTGSGLVLLKENTLQTTRFDSDNNLVVNNVYSALLYDSILLLGTENGLIRTNVKNLLQGQLEFKYLNRKSGLAGDRVNYLVKGQNSVWAITDNGISIIPDSLQNFTNRNPTFYLKSITVNKVAINATEIPELHYDQNDITFSFGFISFNNNESIRTRFRLSPNDPWVLAENRDLQFFSLSPGPYSLTIEYSIDNNRWRTAIDQMKFYIKPPWWKAWYYQLTALLVSVAVIFLYFKWQLSLSRRKQQLQQQKLLQTEIQATERERSRIAKDLHDTVGTNLAAVKMAVSQLLRKHHEPLSENIESQLQEIMKETKEIIYHLVPPGLERLGLFTLTRNHIAKLNATSLPTINLTTSGHDVFNAHLNIIIFRIIQELLSNALKHANATSITIDINTFENHLNFLFEDNGIGFNKEEKKEGLGLVNIQSRVESLQGTIKVEAGFSGTSYIINIPYANQKVV